jgi:hypothetical protein
VWPLTAEVSARADLVPYNLPANEVTTASMSRTRSPSPPSGSSPPTTSRATPQDGRTTSASSPRAEPRETLRMRHQQRGHPVGLASPQRTAQRHALAGQPGTDIEELTRHRPIPDGSTKPVHLTAPDAFGALAVRRHPGIQHHRPGNLGQVASPGGQPVQLAEVEHALPTGRPPVGQCAVSGVSTQGARGHAEPSRRYGGRNQMGHTHATIEWPTVSNKSISSCPPVVAHPTCPGTSRCSR